MTTVFAATLVFASWGCGGSNANYPSNDGSAQHDAEVKEDAGGTDGHRADGHVGDGGDLGDAGGDALELGPPTVTIIAPAAGAAAKTKLGLKFTVNAPAGIKAQTPEVSVDGAVVTVTGLDTPTADDLEFTGEASYDMPLSCSIGGLAAGSHQVAVKAWDVLDRAGTGSAAFVIDCAGPTLTPVTPIAGSIVGGPTGFQVTIEDGAGIDDSKVTLEFTESGQTVSLALQRFSGSAGGNGDFGIYYDTGALPSPMIRPQILWRAYDLLGNESHLAYQIAIDNTPPLVALTSPGVYVGKWAQCWSKCGDGVCETDKGEDAAKCARDCPPVANDGICSAGETDPVDCGARCGDGICDTTRGENHGNCPHDCPSVVCGDGICSHGENCPEDCGSTCPNGSCDVAQGESAVNCPDDCFAPGCGNWVCEATENPVNCPHDCIQGCGNGVCEPSLGETITNCPADCMASAHGDGVCSPSEDCDSSPGDCGYCRDHVCPPDDLILECSTITGAPPSLPPYSDPLANWVYAYAAPGTTNARPAAWVHLQDGKTVPQAVYMRARVEDRGNFVTGDAFVPVSSVDPASVRLFLLHHDRLPLVKEGPGGSCVINPDLHETTQVNLADDYNVLVIDMLPVPVGGTPNYKFWGDATPPAPYPSSDVPSQCDVRGDPAVTTAPRKRCDWISDYVQATYSIPAIHEQGLPPAVYAPGPVNDTGPMCEGSQVDLGYMDTDRWFCAAVVARDKVGNYAVSRPLHLCLSRDWTTGGPCDTTPSGTCVSTGCATQVEDFPIHPDLRVLVPDKP